jgi:uncharacterized membrane protein YphA (DoxX/SURF4 family)
MTSATHSRGKLVWTLQILMALLFVFAGVAKLTATDAQLTEQSSMLSAGFLRFIAVCELLGGAGLVLPMLLKIRPGLTPVAAACLVVIMVGATVTTAMTMPLQWAIPPFVVGALLVFVARSRWPLLREGVAPREFA